jgi:ElaB/YqjD/DUF883 family membrane-anchored ribosome-binding protein
MESTTSTTQRSMDKNIDKLSQGAHSVVDRAASAASTMAERVGQKGDDFMQMKDTWVEGAADYVREHPLAALGMAVAAGYLFSMITRGR